MAKNMKEFEHEIKDGWETRIEKEEKELYVIIMVTDFGTMNAKLEELGIEPKNAEIQRLPLNTVELPVAEAKDILDLVEKFEDDDDVQNVYHNLEITEELMDEIDQD